MFRGFTFFRDAAFALCFLGLPPLGPVAFRPRGRAGPLPCIYQKGGAAPRKDPGGDAAKKGPPREMVFFGIRRKRLLRIQLFKVFYTFFWKDWRKLEGNTIKGIELSFSPKIFLKFYRGTIAVLFSSPWIKHSVFLQLFFLNRRTCFIFFGSHHLFFSHHSAILGQELQRLSALL